LHFELASQTELQPPHWLEPESYRPLNAWLIGQAVALRELSWQLGKAGANPGPQMMERWEALSVVLRQVTVAISSLPKLPASEGKRDYAAMQKAADAIAKATPDISVPERDVRALLIQLAQTASELPSDKTAATDENGAAYERAYALTAALERLTIELRLDARPQIATPLAQLRQDLFTHATFTPEGFAKDATLLKNQYITSSPK